jgi:flavin-dependent dehydrogenase
MESLEMHEAAFDVVVMGGAFSGASTAWLLKQRNPSLRVCIVERDLVFKRRVGESTVEMSAHFLNEVLGMGRYLNEQHLVKQGLRFWFYSDSNQPWQSCSEIGPEYHVRLPGYQVDRAALDEALLGRAVEVGAVLMRGWKVAELELAAGAMQQILIKGSDGQERRLESRWVVDAGGSQCFLSRKLGWYRRNERHPIASIWSRWKGVESLDAPEVRAECAGFAARCKGSRYTATNHFVGKGWWAWCIPLKSGEVSIGVVYDERHVDLSAVPGLEAKLRHLLDQHPVARRLMARAELDAGDLHFRRKLPYSSSSHYADGVALVGDAAGFIDPFYSPGLDWVAYTSYCTAELIAAERKGESPAPLIEDMNHRFSVSYSRWFEAIYENKYDYMGDYELMNLAFQLDLGTYYLGIVSQPYKMGAAAFGIPAFSGRHSDKAAKLIRAYNRRLSAIARRRLRVGSWGAKNHGHAHRFQSFELNGKLPGRVFRALLSWLKLEMSEGWRTWFTREKDPAHQPQHL